MTICYRLLTLRDGTRARCIEPRGIQHDHDSARSVEVGRLSDFIASHGFGMPTRAGLKRGCKFISQGSDYAEAAAAVVTLGLTTESED